MPLAFSSKCDTWESKTAKYFHDGAWLQWSAIYPFMIQGWECLFPSSHSLPEDLYSTDPYVIHTMLWKVEGKKKPSLGASHACGRCEVLNFVWQGHSSEAKVEEIDSATRRNSIPLKYEGKTEGEERRASLELLDFVQSRKIICSLHLPQHHMLPLNPSFWTWKDQNLMVFMRLKSWAIGNFL